MTTLNKLLLFCMVAMCFSCNGQSAQNPGASTADTVSQLGKNIWYVYQDSRNDYWFGSNGEGVYRYDGKNLVRFTHKDGLCNDSVRGIQEDKQGNIYFNTANGISRYDGKALTTLKSVNSNLPDRGWQLNPDDLWFAGAQDSGVLYRYDARLASSGQRGTLFRLTFPKTKVGEDFIANFPRSKYPHMTFNPYDVYGIYRDRKGNVWFGTNIGLCRYNGNYFAWMSEKELGIDAIAFHVRSIIEDRNDRFWFTNTMHRFVVNDDSAGNSKASSISYKEEAGPGNLNGYTADDYGYFLSGLEDTNGDLWFVTYNKGAWRYDGKNITNYRVKDGNKEATLFSIYKDRKGDLWLGTHAAGVYKFNGKTFERFKL